MTEEDGDFYESLKKTVRNRDLDSDSSFERMWHVGPQDDEVNADQADEIGIPMIPNRPRQQDIIPEELKNR